MAKMDQGKCEFCHEPFGYKLYHCGFGNCAYAYCDSCGRVAVLDEYGNVPSECGFRAQGPIAASVVPFLRKCDCGGTFRGDASPRCPTCNHPLSAQAAAMYIERNAIGIRLGWAWQRSWVGIYCIDVGGRAVHDNWLHE